MKKNTILFSLFLVILSIMLFSSTVHARKYTLERFGVKSCTGSINGSGTQDTRYGARNRNPDKTLIIRAIKVYDADANLVYDSAADGFPGGMKTTLPPRHSTSFVLSTLVSLGSGTWTAGPGIVEVSWRSSGASFAMPISVGGFRRTTDGSGNILAERPQGCRSIPLN